MQFVIGQVLSVSDLHWFLETEDGRFLKLTFEGDERPPINQRLALQISDEPEYADESYAVPQVGKYYRMMPDPGLAAAVTDRVHIALCRKVPVNCNEAFEAQQLERCAEWARGMEDFWRTYLHDRVEVWVEPYTLRSDCSATPPSFCRQEIGNMLRTQELPEGFQPNYFHVWDRYSNGSYCGLAYIGREVGATYQGCTVKTAIHEIGHNLGLRHANEPNEEYGDLSDVMGKSRTITGLNSPNVNKLGAEDESEVTEVTDTCRLLLCPIELEPEAMHPGECQTVILRGSGDAKYWVSMRKVKGFPYTPAKANEPKLFIHSKNEEYKTVLVDTLRPGARADLPGGIAVINQGFHKETIVADFLFAGAEPDFGPPEFPPLLPEPPVPGTCTPAHCGLWYNPHYNGQGLDITVRSGRMTLMWYTFNEGEKSRRWYIAHGSVSKPYLDLYTYDQGTFEDPTRARQIPAGQVQVYFEGGDCIFRWHTVEHGRGSTRLTLLAHSNDPRSGLWFQPDRDREGFSIQVVERDDADVCVAYWYTYGANPYPVGQLNHKRLVTQRWFMAHGEQQEDGRFAMTIFEIRDSEWRSLRDPVVTPVGVMTLWYGPGDEINIEYDIAADESVQGVGTRNLRRLL